MMYSLRQPAPLSLLSRDRPYTMWRKLMTKVRKIMVVRGAACSSRPTARYCPLPAYMVQDMSRAHRGPYPMADSIQPKTMPMAR